MAAAVRSQRSGAKPVGIKRRQMQPSSPGYQYESGTASRKLQKGKYASAPLSPPLSSGEDSTSPPASTTENWHFGKLNACDEERMEYLCRQFFSAMYTMALDGKVLAHARKYNAGYLSQNDRIDYQTEFTFQMKNAVKAVNDRYVAKKLHFNDVQMQALKNLQSALHKVESTSIDGWEINSKSTSAGTRNQTKSQMTSYNTAAGYYQPRSSEDGLTWGRIEFFRPKFNNPVRLSHRKVFKALHLFLMSLLNFDNDAAVMLYNSSVHAKLKQGFVTLQDASKSVAAGTFYFWNLAIMVYATDLGPTDYDSKSRMSLMKYFLGKFSRPLGLAVHLLPSLDDNVKKRRSSVSSIRERSTSSLTPGFEAAKRKRTSSNSGSERRQSAMAQQLRAIVQRCLEAMDLIGDGLVHQTAERFFGSLGIFNERSAADVIKACYENSNQIVDLQDCLVIEMILSEKTGSYGSSGISKVLSKDKLTSIEDVRLLESEVDNICMLSKWLAVLVRISLPFSVPTADTTKFSLSTPKHKSAPQLSFTEAGKAQFKSSQCRGEGTVPWLVSELLMRYLMVVQPYLQKILKLLKTGGSKSPTKYELIDTKNVGKNLFTSLRTKSSVSSNFQADIEQVYSEWAIAASATSNSEHERLRLKLMEKLRGVAQCGVQDVEKEFEELVNEDVRLVEGHSIIPFY